MYASTAESPWPLGAARIHPGHLFGEDLFSNTGMCKTEVAEREAYPDGPEGLRGYHF